MSPQSPLVRGLFVSFGSFSGKTPRHQTKNVHVKEWGGGNSYIMEEVSQSKGKSTVPGLGATVGFGDDKTTDNDKILGAVMDLVEVKRGQWREAKMQE